IDESFIDPVAFRDDSQLGVPGLMSCVRKGTVTIANAIGTGVGDNRALAGFLPKLSRFYLNEPLMLPTVDRLICWDPDQCEQMLAQLEEYHIASASERTATSTWNPREMTVAEVEELRGRISAAPAQYVAEPQLPLSQLPTHSGTDFAPRHTGMRIFALGGRLPQVYPCALTRYAVESGSRTISSGMGGGIKDTWILRGTETPAFEAPIVVSSPQRRLRLGSRIADSLYWTGRYIERAENTTRTLKVLQQVQVEDQMRQNAESWIPLWEALARATGHPTNFFKRSALLRKQSVSHYILLDRNNPSSVISCLATCRWNAQSIRESVPPELWVIINRLHQILENAAASPRLNDKAELTEIAALQSDILHQIDALGGAATKSMLRDDGWHFWSMGMHVERALTTVLVTRQVLLKRQGETPSAHDRNDSNLDALLRMLSCQYAYRSLFQARPTLENAATMLLQDGQLPRSLLYCLESVERSLRTIFGDQQRSRSDTPLKLCSKLVAEVSFTDLNPYFNPVPGARGPQMRNWLDEVADRLATLSTAISDHYLHHQAFNILR
ncbi:MAG TPA: circularly permuted type 2 ATP-grasp protein, partial [Roseimicrobium sp.]|nr:circularly permuted type 2 ATP-grasp protein [Roseimicrobium sp.]